MHFKCENRNVNEFLYVNYLNFYWVKYMINLLTNGISMFFGKMK